MTARRSALEFDSDRKVYRALQVAAQHHADDEEALAEYIGMALRQRWTWVLIAEALHMSPRRAAAVWRRDLKRRGIE